MAGAGRAGLHAAAGAAAAVAVRAVGGRRWRLLAGALAWPGLGDGRVRAGMGDAARALGAAPADASRCAGAGCAGAGTRGRASTQRARLHAFRTACGRGRGAAVAAWYAPAGDLERSVARACKRWQRGRAPCGSRRGALGPVTAPEGAAFTDQSGRLRCRAACLAAGHFRQWHGP
ncbi:hypothetical protein G6F31_015553 [Rhizopus arrhizus]|nr:hypothetical protein G6F31_015553 [Rhizopus arrhizus]